MDAEHSFSFYASSLSSLSTLFTSQSSVSPTDTLAGFLLLLSLKIILLHVFMSAATCSSRYAFQRTLYGFSFNLPDLCSFLFSLFGYNLHFLRDRTLRYLSVKPGWAEAAAKGRSFSAASTIINIHRTKYFQS